MGTDETVFSIARCSRCWHHVGDDGGW